jgi:hypothetical protein
LYAGSVSRFGRILHIGRLSSFASFFENYRSSANSWATFFHSTSYKLIPTKNGSGDFLGDILGDFFTSSSGHPVCR